MAEAKTTNDPNVIYCVVAVIDLVGFAAHLEVGAHDLRTTVGHAAVERLSILEEARKLVLDEKKTAPFAIPSSLKMTRINDALILQLDLPNRLRPQTGETGRSGYNINEMSELFSLDKYVVNEDEEGFEKHVITSLQTDVQALAKFVGLVARIHVHVNGKEAENHFAGAKTICSTGFRRKFDTEDNKEEWLSANFAFANAFTADRELHGPNLFIDDNVLQLICIDTIGRNIVRYSSFVSRLAPFEPANDPEEGFYSTLSRVPSEAKQITLFRKPFFFREVNPFPLTHLQTVDYLRPYIENEKQPAAKSIFDLVKSRLASGPDVEAMRAGELSSGIPFYLSLSTSFLLEYTEIVEHGESETRNQRIREEMLRLPFEQEE
jgi:hypothetical protein